MKKIILSILLTIGLMAGFGTPSHAVVSSTISQNKYACDSTTTSWAYTFPIILTTDIQVWTIDSFGNPTQQLSNFSVNTVTQHVTYPVSGTPCATGNSLLLLRVQPLTQQVEASNQGPAPSPVVMTMSDKLTMISQQLQAEMNRAVLAPIGSTSSSGYALPSPLANAYIGWDPTATFLTNLSVGQNLYPTASPTFVGLTLTGLNGILKSANASGVGIATADVDYSVPNGSETLTNKTYDTTGTGNVFKVAGTTLGATGVLGSGKVVLATSLTGNTGVVPQISGTGTSGHCAKFDASGNIVDNGSSCSGGSGMTYPSDSGITVSNSSAWVASIPNTTLTAVSGNVGIGTNLPSAELDVEGTISPVVFFGRGNDYNVGIGLLAPGKQLDVNGTVRATYFTGNLISNVGIGTNVPGGVLDVEGTLPTIFYGHSVSNVGIGSLSPGQALDVQGTVRALHFSGIQASDVPALSYAPQTSGSSILYGNGSGGFSNVTIGSGLTFSGGSLSSSGRQVFTSSGTFTAPNAVTTVYLSMVGGGGGGAAGGNGGGGGGGQGIINYPYTVIGGNSYTVTIGSGGSGAVGGSAGAGTDGNATLFDVISVASGLHGTHGGGGTGSGGVGGGSINASGATPGNPGFVGGNGSNNSGSGGAGGGSIFGTGGAGPSTGDGSNAVANTGAGGGGGGGGGSGGAGGNGGSGICIVQY